MRVPIIALGIVAVSLAMILAFMPARTEYNVVIFAFDGLQAKHLHAYGYEKSTTPNLDQFLARSYLFTNAVSPASWTVPTYMSLFTSRYPSEHKLTNKLVEVRGATTTRAVTANVDTLSPGTVRLAEVFKSAGYATAGFTGDAGVSAAFGYGKGFDEYYDKDAFGGLDNSVPRAREWLHKHKDEKFFMFVHGYDVHGQHVPKSGFDYRYVDQPYTGPYTGSAAEQTALRERGLAGGTLAVSEADKVFWRATYDEKINDADVEFGAFMQDLKEAGVADTTIVVVVSDHGTEFFEHGRVDHGHTLYSELLNVLFAIHVPGQEGGTIPLLVSTLDLMPTLLPLVGLTAEGMRGVDLRPAFSGKEVAHDVYSETDYRLYTHKRSITTVEGWKLILTRETGDTELYNLQDDPGELHPVIDAVKSYELEQKLLKHLKDVGDVGPWPIGCLAVYADQCR